MGTDSDSTVVEISAGGKKVRMTTKQLNDAANGAKKNRERIKKDQDAEDEKFKDSETGGISGQRLKAFIERIERLEEEKTSTAEDIKDIYAEAKGTGFDTKTIRKVVKLRKMDAEKRREADELLELYKAAIGLE